MPLGRYFLWVGSVLLTLLFIVDACLPTGPAARTTTDAPPPAIRIHSERKWPERIVFDTSASMPRVANATNSVEISSAQQTAAVIPGPAREAMAQLQTSDVVQVVAANQRKQEARSQRQQKAARRHVARQAPRAARQPQYAWFGSRMWR